MNPIQNSTCGPRRLLLWYGLATLLAVFTYFYGLDSDHIPKNGDEYPYSHITRLTAASGHLLPLQSELDGMRNTKPPLLFWQGIASTGWGKNWTLWHLRYPSVIYTLLTALMVFLLGWKLSRQLATGFLALLTFLAFFSTYRYGRPFLTDPPEVFWLFVPLFVLLYWPRSGSRFLAPVLLGLGIGLGLLYKSFALLLPVMLCLSWWFLQQRGYRLATFLVKDAWKLAVMAFISLAVFSLWFVLDPNPQAVFKEFVLGENVGKFDPHGGSYLAKLLWGGSSVWLMVASYPLNAGLLAFPVVMTFFVAWKRRGQTADAEKLLWMWVVTLVVVFSLPSQRDERYLLPGMPALAILCALNWHQISRKAFVASLAAAGALVVFAACLSIQLQRGMTGVQIYPATYWALLIATATIIALAFLPRYTRSGVNVASLMVLLCFAAFMRPLDGALGNFSAEAQRYAAGKDVWVPINFRAKEEGYRFTLPGANARPYRYDPRPTATELGRQYPLFIIRLPMKDPDPTGSRILGQRLDVEGRQSSSQIKEMLRGKVFENLFIKELLIETSGPGTNAASNAAVEARR